MKTKLLKNKDMNPITYDLRREVIQLIHEAKKLVPTLPRLTVRVTNNDEKILGVAQIGNNIIWITEDAVVSRAVVFHEILHAVYAQQHVAGCPLMNTHINHRLPRQICDKLFLKYAGAK